MIKPRAIVIFPDLSALLAFLKQREGYIRKSLLAYPDTAAHIKTVSDVIEACAISDEEAPYILFQHPHIAALSFTQDELFSLLAKIHSPDYINDIC